MGNVRPKFVRSGQLTIPFGIRMISLEGWSSKFFKATPLFRRGQSQSELPLLKISSYTTSPQASTSNIQEVIRTYIYVRTPRGRTLKPWHNTVTAQKRKSAKAQKHKSTKAQKHKSLHLRPLLWSLGLEKLAVCDGAQPSLMRAPRATAFFLRRTSVWLRCDVCGSDTDLKQ